jgi:hypothetical protein
MMMRPFVIISATRCGSTSLFRALNLIPGTWVVNQPMFDNRPLCESAVTERVTELLSDYSGFKHVFDPTGYPFQDLGPQTIGEMERDAELWNHLNTVILNYPNLRVVFLRRRDSFQRVVSDLVAQDTGNWGYFDLSVSPNEPALYKEAVSKSSLSPLNENLVRWYVEKIPQIFDRLRSAVRTNIVTDLWYEDVFGDDIGMPERIERFRELVEFLQISAPSEMLNSVELSLLLRPSAKLNDASIFERIPNYCDLRKKLANPGETGPGGRVALIDDSYIQPSSSLVAELRADSSSLQGWAEDIIRPGSWRLRAAGDTLAGVMFPPDQPDAVRVVIAKANTNVAFDVQLNAADLRVESKRSYTLRFRARADHGRSIYVGVAQAHAPWMGLGLYNEIGLSTEWRDFQREFVASADDDQARIHFDLGTCGVSVDIAKVSLR